jgi:hypothetical protein
MLLPDSGKYPWRNMQNNFFPETQAFEVQIGDANSFIWACYSGLWHLVSEAKRLNDALGVTDWKKAEAYLMPGAPGAGGVDLNEIAIRRPWAAHEDEFEQNILIQMSVLYEEWAVTVCQLIDPSFDGAADLLQFPASMPRNRLAIKTWMAWKSAIDGNPSVLIANEFQPGLLARYNSGIRQIEPLLKWYRFFKECRNTRVHSSGRHTDASVKAFNEANVAPLTTCGLSRDLALSNAPAVGRPATMGLKNALLGMAVVQRLANAFDALLCHSPSCETYMLAKLTTASKAIDRIPGAAPAKRNDHIRSILTKAQLPLSANFVATDNYLKAHGLIKF